MVERGQNNEREKRNQYQRYNYLLRPLFLVLGPGGEPSLHERLIINRKIDREGDGRGTKNCKEEPTLPIMECACRPKDEDNERYHSQDPLADRPPIEWVHRNTVTPASRGRLRLQVLLKSPGLFPPPAA